MRHAFDIAGSAHEVWVSRDSGGYRVEAGGAPVAARLEPLGGGRFLLTLGDERVPVTMAREGDSIHLHIDGSSHVARFLDPVRRHAETEGGEGEDLSRAPMPGTVVAVAVAEGQAVAEGEPLMVIESMKLETTIRAWRDGEVEAVHVRPGQSFDRGAPLVTLRHAGA
jgi:biotin carboxyl carrier protein